MPLSMPAFAAFRSVALAALAILIVTCTVGAYPKPSQVPYRWELQFDAGDLRLYVDPIDGAVYWSFNYTVTNHTDGDQIWAPSFVLFTDTGEIIRSGVGVPMRVEEDICSLLGNPLLETQNEIIGDIFQGREHAKDGLVVWRAGSTNVNELSLFIAGISGETARVNHPITGHGVILRKTLQRDYLIRGSALARGSRPVEFLKQGWVLR